MKYTEEQRKIIEHQGGHAKVMAVAGSGKTTTMIERIIHLIKEGQDPRRILVLMFNASASEEFSVRLKKRASEEGVTSLPEVRTFHAMALKLCKFLESKGVIKPAQLETKDWVFTSMADAALSPHLKSNKSKKEAQEDFYQFIDLVNSDIQTPREKLAEMPDITGTKMPDYFAEAYDKFEEARRDRGIRFFSDLIKDPIFHIFNNEEDRCYIENIYDHIILDEYQDINEVQQRMTVYIAGNRAKVMAVGDADQCIYEWRGAKPEYIVSLFENDFPDAKKYLLSQTYRYGDELSLFVNNIISLNNNRDNKLCISNDNNPDTLVFQEKDTSVKSPLVSHIKKMKEEGYDYDAMAILLRKFSMSLNPELEMIKANIPYVIIGANSVFKRQEIMAMEGAFHIANNSFDTVDPEHRKLCVEAFIKIPFSGVRAEESTYLANKLCQQKPDGVDLGQDIVSLLTSKANSLDKKKRRQLTEKLEAVSYLKRMKDKFTIYRLARRYVDEVDMYGYFEWSSSTEAVAQEKEMLIEEFLGYMKKEKSQMEDFIKEWVSLAYQSVDTNNVTNVKKVLITSIHRSKGLEWPLVIMPELKDEAFPGLKKKHDRVIEEAERRLFYVGATRAKNRLVLVHPRDDVLKTWERSSVLPFPYNQSFVATRYLFEGALNEVKQVADVVRGDSKDVKINEKALYTSYFKQKGLDIKKIKGLV